MMTRIDGIVTVLCGALFLALALTSDTLARIVQASGVCR